MNGRRSLAFVVALGAACANRTVAVERPDVATHDTPPSDVASGDASSLDATAQDAASFDAAQDASRSDAPGDEAGDARPDAQSPDDAPDDAATDAATPDDAPPDDAALDLPMGDATGDADAAGDATADAPPVDHPVDLGGGDASVCGDGGCPPGTFCEAPGRCTPWRCFPGQTWCISGARARVCDALGSGSVERECGDGCARDVCRAATPCVPPRVRCGTTCVDVPNDRDNCGACGRACAPWCACAGGTCPCYCPGGTTLCLPTCRDLTSDARNCGRCDLSCPVGQVCLASTCRPEPVVTPTLASLDVAGCVASEHAAHNGRDRGGLVAGSYGVYHNGSARTAVLSGTTLAPTTPLPVPYDGLLTDLTTGVVYAPQSATGAAFEGVAADATAGFTVTQLVPFATSPLYMPTPLRLRAAITLHHDAGFFSSWRYVVLYSGGPAATRAWYVVSLLTGAVVATPAAGAPPAHRTCPNGAWWGVAERTADGTRVVYARDARSIVRTSLADLRTDVVATADFGAACAVAASPRAGRWYFHHSGPSSFAPAGEEVTVGCPARFAAAP